MSNNITGKYFENHVFADRIPEILEAVCLETGFVSDCEIFRGYIYDREKVGSVIHRGQWQGKTATLKLQGLKLETEEAAILQGFTAQNRSMLVRVPEVFTHQPWDDARGYGYMLSEYVDAVPIFEMPTASLEQIGDFCRFFQEYRTNSVREPWIPAPEVRALDFTLARVANWRRICEHKGRLAETDYAARCDLFTDLANQHLGNEKLVFCHGHLTANDILKTPNGGCILMSNLFWGWRLPWHDLAFNIWACNLHQHPGLIGYGDVLDEIGLWRTAYKAMPVVQADPDFDRRFDFVMLERTLGAILADLGAGDSSRFQTKILFDPLLKLHQELFDQLALELA
ncbi:phosphotransferase [Candidatus Uhrbacteria bacterium]|nr:phosphotransferase [Candidatus Uhrbacteria bacterium]